MRNLWTKLAALLLTLALLLPTIALSEAAVDITGDIAVEVLPEDAGIVSDEAVNLELMEDLIELPEAQVDLSLPEATGVDEDNASKTVTLGVKESATLDTNGLGSKLTFKSSKPTVASVTKKGVVKGLKKGTSVVSVLSGKKVVAKYTVKVVAAPSKVTLAKKSVKLGLKESITLKPTLPSGTHASFNWINTNSKVATVTKAGKITAKKVGTTNITVKTHNGKKATVKVTVAKAPTSVKLNMSTAELDEDETLQLKATLSSGSASYSMTWDSSDPDVASVDNKGLVTACAEGSADITVVTYNGKAATCRVTVKGEDEGPKLFADVTNLSLTSGESRDVVITYLGEESIYWHSDDEGIATCKWVDGWDGDDTVLTVTGVSAGSTTVTVYDESEKNFVSINVTVTGVQKVTELSRLMFKDIATANAMLDDKMYYDAENDVYANNYFMAEVNSSGTIDMVGFFNNYGDYTLMGQWPGRDLGKAANALFDDNWELLEDKDQVGTFVHSELPGIVLSLKYGNGVVKWIMITAL